MPLVEIPEFGEVEFPDTMTGDEIAGVIREKIIPNSLAIRKSAQTAAIATDVALLPVEANRRATADSIGASEANRQLEEQFGELERARQARQEVDPNDTLGRQRADAFALEAEDTTARMRDEMAATIQRPSATGEGGPLIVRDGANALTPLRANPTPEEATASQVEAAAQRGLRQAAPEQLAEGQRQERIQQFGREPGAFETFAARVSGGFTDLLAAGAEMANLPGVRALRDRAQDLASISELGSGVSADVARGAGDVTTLLVGNQAGSLGLATAAMRGAVETRERVLGQTGDPREADAAALQTYPALGLFMVAGLGAAKGAMAAVGADAGKVAKTLAAFSGAEAANVGSDAIIHAINEEPMTVRSLTAATLLAVHAAKGAYKSAKLGEETQRAVDQEIQDRGITRDVIDQYRAGVLPRSETPAMRLIRPGEEMDLSSFSAPRPKVVATKPEIAKAVDSPAFAPAVMPEAKTPPTLRPFPSGSQVGGIFAPRRPSVAPVGSPPSGSRNWLEIPRPSRRIFSGLFTDGAAKVLSRTANPVGQELGKATDRQFEVEGEIAGQFQHRVEQALRGMSSKQQERAFDELEFFLREKENGRVPAPLQRDASRIYDAWQDIAEFSGLLSQRQNVQVADASAPGGFRPMHLLGREYTPRMFDPLFERAIREPKNYPAEWNNYVAQLARHQGISQNEAAAVLNDMAGGKNRYGENNFMGNLEIARQERFPESFYDYDLRRMMSRYSASFARRMGQIVSYGQRLGEGGSVQKNLWDLARDDVRGGDKTTSKWLNEAEAQSNNETLHNESTQLFRRLQTFGTGALLGTGIAAARNAISGISTTAELLGTRRTMAAMAKFWGSQNRQNAREAGAVRDDMAMLLHAERLTGDSLLDRGIRAFTDTALKVTGYDAAEKFVRTTNFLAASAFARDFVDAYNANPTSRKTKQMAAQITRMGVEPDFVLSESGDWKTGYETRKFIRKIINEQQGGYKFNQVPLWASTPTGRFFYQFGRWGTQRAKNIRDNILKPAFMGTETTVGGKTFKVRDFKPLLRLGAGIIGTGEAYALLAQGLFGRDRRDESISEIVSAGKESGQKMMGLIGNRLLNDTIMSGMLGIYGQPLDWIKAAKDGSRLKNPAEPPGGVGVRALSQLAQDYYDQGEVTRGDWMRFASGFAPGVKVVNDTVKNWASEPLYEAQNDIKTLRAAGLRYAKEKGLDVPPAKFDQGARKSANSPEFERVQEALLIGDTGAARREMNAFVRAQKPGPKREEAMDNLRASVISRQPFRIGSLSADKYKGPFNKWAKKNLSADDWRQIERVQARYERTAARLGLWKG